MKKLVMVALMVVVGSSLPACKKEEATAAPKVDKAATDKAAADKAAADKAAADKAAADKAAADKAAPSAACTDAASKFADLGLADPDMKAGMEGQTPEQVKGVHDQLAARFQAVCSDEAAKCMAAATSATMAVACEDAAKAAAPAVPAAPATK